MRTHLVREEGDVLVIILDDPAALNEGQSHGLRQILYNAVESRERPKVAIDLAAIDYLSSTGIALLIGLKRRVDIRQGRLILFQVQKEVYELFGIMKLVNLFLVVDDQDQAFELLRSPLPD